MLWTFKILLKWRNFAQSGHTGDFPDLGIINILIWTLSNLGDKNIRSLVYSFGPCIAIFLLACIDHFNSIWWWFYETFKPSISSVKMASQVGEDHLLLRWQTIFYFQFLITNIFLDMILFGGDNKNLVCKVEVLGSFAIYVLRWLWIFYFIWSFTERSSLVTTCQ